MITNQDFSTKFTITDDWGGSYRVVLDLEALSTVKDWKIGVSLPNNYKIDQIYGAELTQEDNNKYISGVDWNKTLDRGNTTEIVLIIDEGGSNSAPILPQLLFTDFVDNSTAKSSEKIIYVDNDFDGNLEKAIAAANDGDLVQLGSNTYYTRGITIDKDITIDGQEGTVIDGTGTSEAIFNLTSGASGATIQELKITNGNNGIYGYNVSNLTLQNLAIENIGINQTIRDGQNNTGIVLNRADGLQLLDSTIYNVGRKGVGINDTDGALVSGLTVQNVNLRAQHAQSHDAAGIKFFNTNDVILKDSYFSDLNTIYIWNDTTNSTTIEGNVMENVGEDFLKPDFNLNVDISGIYNEKSSNSIIRNNQATSVDRFLALNATEFSTETMTFEGNDFSSIEINTQDYWVNESAEKLIATTEDPLEADFSIFADEYFAQANI